MTYMSFDDGQYVLHVHRPGQVGIVCCNGHKLISPDTFLLTVWEDDDRKAEICMSRAKFLQVFEWRECLECGHEGQVQPGYWNCAECAQRIDGYKGWAEPILGHDPKEPIRDRKP